MWRRLLFFAPIWACGFSFPPSGPGVLGNATFFPPDKTQFAVGSNFEVDAFCNTTGACTIATVDSVSGVPGPNFREPSAGWDAFVARDRSGTVVDFIQLHFVDADSLTLTQNGKTPFEQNLVGTSVVVNATLFGQSIALSGDYGCTWNLAATFDEATYTPVRGCSLGACLNESVVDLNGPGDVTITATCLGHSASLTWTNVVSTDADAASSDEDASDD